MAELFEVRIPHGGSVENVEITEWLVAPGDVVAEGDPLAEVSTDKVDTELVSPRAGRIAKLLHAAEEDELKVGTVVALLAEADATEADVAASVSAHVIGEA